MNALKAGTGVVITPVEDPDTSGAQVKDGINLGATESEAQSESQLPDADKEPEVFPVQSIEERLGTANKLDSSAIRDRILTLKLMFDDASDLRRQREFLSKVNTKEGDQVVGNNLDLMVKYNVNK